jgi:ribonuclease-3
MKEFDHESIEAVIGYSFRNKDLLLQAFTRSSFAEERDLQPCGDNEVLEFIGDTALSAVIVRKLSDRQGSIRSEEEAKEFSRMLKEADFCERFENYFLCDLTEKELSELKISLVSGKTLAAAMSRLGLQEYLRMGKGDVLQNVQEQASVKEDLLEAILGAVALDSGWDFHALENAVDRLLEPDRLLEEGVPGEENYLSTLGGWHWNGLLSQEPRYETEYVLDRPLPWSCRLELTYQGLCYRFCAASRTEKGARRLAAKKAVEKITRDIRDREALFAVVGTPVDWERSVQSLHELAQKKLISPTRYDFFPGKRNAESGNPYWICRAEGDGGIAYETAECETKAEAKAEAAKRILRWYLGMFSPTLAPYEVIDKGPWRNIENKKNEEDE